MLQRSIPAGFIAPWEDWSGEQHPAASDPHIALGLSDDRNGSRPGRGDGSGISRQVRTGRRERQTILILIKGLAEGVAWADAYNQSRGVARVYCPPGHFFSLQPEQLMDIFRREVEARPVLRQEPWQRATIEALRNVFPCKRR